jgi:hypothetical protein
MHDSCAEITLKRLETQKLSFYLFFPLVLQTDQSFFDLPCQMMKTMPLDIAEEFHEKKLLELKTLHAVRPSLKFLQPLNSSSTFIYFFPSHFIPLTHV